MPLAALGTHSGCNSQHSVYLGSGDGVRIAMGRLQRRRLSRITSLGDQLLHLAKFSVNFGLAALPLGDRISVMSKES